MCAAMAARAAKEQVIAARTLLASLEGTAMHAKIASMQAAATWSCPALGYGLYPSFYWWFLLMLLVHRSADHQLLIFSLTNC